MTLTGKVILCSMVLSWNCFASFDHNHTAWSNVLKVYRHYDGRFRYAALRQAIRSNPNHEMTVYLMQLSQVSPSTYSGWSREGQMAFLINGFNALTIQLVVEHYPLKNIRKIRKYLKGPWTIPFFNLLGGKIKYLDSIRSQLSSLRDFRVLGALHLTAQGGPRLPATAFTANGLNKQLDKVFADFLSDSERNSYAPIDGRVYLSKIFKWYQEYFAPQGGYLKVIEERGPPAAKEAILKGANVEWLDFDWTLSEPMDPLHP